MKYESAKDELGVQRCPEDNHALIMKGAWRYNNRISTTKFHFVCPKCHEGWVCSAEEAENHQNGLEILDYQKKINKLLSENAKNLEKTKLTTAAVKKESLI